MVRVALGGGGNAGGRGDRAQEHLHSPVLQGVVGVDGLLGVVGVVLIVQVELEAAQGVDLLYGDLRAALGRVAVDSRVAGEGAYAADPEGRAAALTGDVLAAVIAAAGRQTQRQGKDQQQRKKLLHIHDSFSSVSSILSRGQPPGRAGGEGDDRGAPPPAAASGAGPEEPNPAGGRDMIKPNPTKVNRHSVHNLFTETAPALLPFHTKPPVFPCNPSGVSLWGEKTAGFSMRYSNRYHGFGHGRGEGIG